MMQMASRIATAQKNYCDLRVSRPSFFARPIMQVKLAKLRLFCLMSAGLERIKYGKVRVKNAMQED